MNRNKTFKYIYGGTLGVDALCYVKREADEQLYEGLKNNENTIFYVFNSRKMGKSSLDTRVRTKLKKENKFICALINFNLISSDKGSVTIDTWYYGIVKTIAKELNLNIYNEANTAVLQQWWGDRKNQTYLDTLTDLLEKILNDFPQNNILIVFDEIDTLKRLDFGTDDLFAFIRGCHNTRSDHPDSAYKRLHFCLVGTATPSDLISDEFRTPFNVGKAIELRGFTLEEAIVGLSEGLRENVDNPNQVLEDILKWTNGQPFLTQKLCALVVGQRDRNPNIEALVQTKIINNWEDPKVDNPEYLRTVRNRILDKDEYIEKRLILYKQIWESEENYETIKPNPSKEQEQLCLSGLVINTGGQLKISNLICRTIFNLKWIEEQLNNLPPASLKEYAPNWESSQDKSFLLTGQTLQDALKWKAKMGGSFADLFPLYSKFLEASKTAEIEAGYAQKNKINERQSHNLLTIREQLLGNITGTQNIKIATEISRWTKDSELILDEMICQSLSSKLPIPKDTEGEWVGQWIKTNIIDNWEKSCLNKTIAEIKSVLLDSERSFWRLETYRQILEGENTDKIDENDLNALLVSRLVVKDDNKLQVANRIYEGIFSQDWIEENLPLSKAFRDWQASYCQDESLLLKGEDLQTAINWIQNKNELSEPEVAFIITSVVWEKWPSNDAVNTVKEFLSQLQTKTKTPAHLLRVIQVILDGTKPQLVLLQDVLQWVGEAEDIPTEDEAKWLKGLVQRHLKKSPAQKLSEYLDYNNRSNAIWKELKYEKAFGFIDEFLEKKQHSPEDTEKVKNYKIRLDKDWKLNYNHSDTESVTNFQPLDVLYSKFERAYNMAGQKEFDQLLDKIVADAGGDLAAIIIFDLSEDLPLYHNKGLKDRNLKLYSALFGEGDDMAGQAIEGFSALNKMQEAFNKFGRKTEFGDQKSILVNFDDGKMVIYFHQATDIPIAICFMAPKEINIGTVNRRVNQFISNIRQKLDDI